MATITNFNLDSSSVAVGPTGGERNIGAHNMANLKRRYDVIIIGSGAGGSSLAYRLGRLGRQVLLVERGDFLKPQQLGASDSVGRYLYQVIKSRDEPLSFVGGQTKFYGAAL